MENGELENGEETDWAKGSKRAMKYNFMSTREFQKKNRKKRDMRLIRNH